MRKARIYYNILQYITIYYNICDYNIKTYLPTYIQRKGDPKPMQIVNKKPGSRGTRFQNDCCGTSLRFAPLKPINLLLPWLLPVVVVLPHGCHMATCRKSYFFFVSPPELRFRDRTAQLQHGLFLGFPH
jgi:hypothetical protein